MRLGLSCLAVHKFRHNFQDCLNSISSCSQEIETTNHFVLHCLNYHYARKTFFENIKLIDSNIFQQGDSSLSKDLLFGSEKLKDDENNALLCLQWSSFSPWRDSNNRCFIPKELVRLAFTL